MVFRGCVQAQGSNSREGHTGMRGILAKLTCLIVLVFSVALMPQTGWAQLSSGSYVTTGQTGAQTQIDAFHTSSFTIAVQDPTLFKGGVFTM